MTLRLLADSVEKWRALTEGTLVVERSTPNDAPAVITKCWCMVSDWLDSLIDRLKVVGYPFRENPQRQRPSANVDRLLDRLEGHTGRLPVSLRAWYELVGSVDLTAIAAQEERFWASNGLKLLGDSVPDPLVVDPVDALLLEYETLAAEDAEEPFLLPFAPDALHKSEISGGQAYGLLLVKHAPALDFEVANYPERLSFVQYVFKVVSWSGFPGLAVYGETGARQLARIGLHPASLLH